MEAGFQSRIKLMLLCTVMQDEAIVMFDFFSLSSFHCPIRSPRTAVKRPAGLLLTYLLGFVSPYPGSGMRSRCVVAGRRTVSFRGTNWPVRLSRPPVLLCGGLVAICATPGSAIGRSSRSICLRRRYEVKASRRAGVAPVKAASRDAPPYAKQRRRVNTANTMCGSPSCEKPNI